MAEKKSWRDLSSRQRTVVVVLGVAEAVLTLAALRDLARRPAAGVRGPKLAWVASFVVQPFGPIGYYLLGRRTD